MMYNLEILESPDRQHRHQIMALVSVDKMSFLSSISCLYFDGNAERQVRKQLDGVVGFARIISLLKKFFLILLFINGRKKARPVDKENFARWEGNV